MKVALYK